VREFCCVVRRVAEGGANCYLSATESVCIVNVHACEFVPEERFAKT
jgi:hypothetical protein